MIKVGDKIQTHCEYDLIEGTCTWVNTEGSHCILNENGTGHLYWCNVEDVSKVSEMSEVNEEEINMNSFDIGDKVVMSHPFLKHFVAGTITNINTSEEDNATYVVNFSKDGTLFAKEDELYDLEGLAVYNNRNGFKVKIIDEVEDNTYLVIFEDKSIDIISMKQIQFSDICSLEEKSSKTDSIIAELRDMLLERSQTGINKYGTTLDRTDLEPYEWCQHLLEELLDAAGYVLRLKKDLEALDSY